jgi:hypothetical protein
MRTFYCGVRVKPGFAKDKELVALGERIYRGGIADRWRLLVRVVIVQQVLAFPRSTALGWAACRIITATQLTSFRDGVRKKQPANESVAAKFKYRIRALVHVAGLRDLAGH